MTNLLIAFNDIGQRAKTITSSSSFTGLHPLTALDSNNKNLYAELTSASHTTYIDFDLGYDGASDITSTSSFICFPSWFLVLQDIELQGDDNSSFSSPDTINLVEYADFNGNQSGLYQQDFISTFTESSAYRYYRLKLGDGANTTKGYWSKFFFGNLLDLGTDPNDVKFSSDKKVTLLKSDGGYTFQRQIAPQVRTIDIEWVGVTDAKVLEFKELFVRYKEPLVYLYATNNSYLSGVNLISANITDYKIEFGENYNTIKVTLKEAI